MCARVCHVCVFTQFLTHTVYTHSQLSRIYQYSFQKRYIKCREYIKLNARRVTVPVDFYTLLITLVL